VLVTRAEDQGVGLQTTLESLGAEVLWIPAIRTEPVPPRGPEGHLPEEMGAFAWVAFTSPNGVRYFFQALRGTVGKLPSSVRVAAIGTATEEALAREGIRVHLSPPRATGRSLGETLVATSGPVPILLPRGRRGREELGGILRKAGWAVTEVILYDTVAPDIGPDALAKFSGGFDAALFASPSAVTNLWEALPADARTALARAKLLPIGSTTAEALRRLGLEPAEVPEDPGVDALVGALLVALGAGGHGPSRSGEP
jgi:uroporphyrinogen-III synthase